MHFVGLWGWGEEMIITQLILDSVLRKNGRSRRRMARRLMRKVNIRNEIEHGIRDCGSVRFTDFEMKLNAIEGARTRKQLVARAHFDAQVQRWLNAVGPVGALQRIREKR